MIQIGTEILPEFGEEITIDVYVHGVCHALTIGNPSKFSIFCNICVILECVFFEKHKVVVIEGSSEATASKQALVELLR